MVKVRGMFCKIHIDISQYKYAGGYKQLARTKQKQLYCLSWNIEIKSQRLLFFNVNKKDAYSDL